MPAQITAERGTSALKRDRCTTCGEPAAYEHAGEVWCALCACEQASRTRGYAVAGLEILATTVSTLRVAGLTDEEIIQAIRQAIDRDEGWRGEEFLVADWQWGSHADDKRFKRIRPIHEHEGGE